MKYRQLGTTGLSVSAVSFGAGPVSGLLTGSNLALQQAAITRAVDLGVNWFDTAAGYGNGQSERSLGQALAKLKSNHLVHVATKVRVNVTGETELRPLVIQSIKDSLTRLGLPRVTLLQLHNSITRNRLDQPTSITPDDVLGPRGILAGMREAQAAGWVDHFGLTGIGDAAALREVLESRQFATIQAPLHWLNPSALCVTPASLGDPDYGGFLRSAHELGIGIFAIRVFAAGALLGAEPSAHTLKTPFFPLDLYRRDQARAEPLFQKLGSWQAVRRNALRYVLSLPEVASAIVGWGDAGQVEEAVSIADEEPLSPRELLDLEALRDALTGESHDVES